jgi:hypothetical protein
MAGEMRARPDCTYGVTPALFGEARPAPGTRRRPEAGARTGTFLQIAHPVGVM